MSFSLIDRVSVVEREIEERYNRDLRLKVSKLILEITVFIWGTVTLSTPDSV